MQYLYPSDNVDIDFLKYLIVHLNLAKYIKGAAIPHIYYRHYKNEKVKVPQSITEQRAIATELDAVQKMIEGYKAQLADLDALAQSIFLDMFGDPITNPKGWETDILKNIVHKDCPISYGIVQPGDEDKDGIPIVRPIDLTTTYIKKDGLKKVSPEVSNNYNRTILRGDEILLCVRGTTGIISLADKSLKGCNVTRGIVPLFFDKQNIWFMFYCFKSPGINSEIQKHTKGATLKQINIGDLRELKIILPPLPLQQQFAERVEAIERQKELLQAQLAEAQTLMAERMQYYFD